MFVDSVSSVMLQWPSTTLLLVCSALQFVAGLDQNSDVEHSLWQTSYVVSLVSICSIICIVVVILACTKWCPRETADKVRSL